MTKILIGAYNIPLSSKEDGRKHISGFPIRKGRVMETGKKLITHEGLLELEAEVQDLKVNKRREIAQKIKEARAQGDLSENAEYDAAKDEQRDIEARIEEIEEILKHAEVVLDDEGDSDRVNIGSKVTILDLEDDTEMSFKLVGTTEVNNGGDKISNESPVGRALMGGKVGDVITVETDAGKYQYRIISINKKKK